MNCPNCKREIDPLTYTGTACPFCWRWLGADFMAELFKARDAAKKLVKRATKQPKPKTASQDAIRGSESDPQGKGDTVAPSKSPVLKAISQSTV